MRRQAPLFPLLPILPVALARPALLALALTVLVAGGAAASNIPDPTFSTIDHVAVGSPSGSALGDSFVVVVYGTQDNPLAGVQVALRFGGSGVRLYEQQEAGTTADCANDVLWRYTDANGVVVFHPRLGGFENAAVIQVRANSVLLGSASARSTDLDGDGDTDVTDLRLFHDNFVAAAPGPQTDYDLDGKTTVRDLDLFRREFMARADETTCP